jgi:hypothetical protein
VLALCHCPPEMTGGVEVSTDLVTRLGLVVHGLDGEPLPEPGEPLPGSGS